MIQTFKNKVLENFFKENINKGVPPNLEKKLELGLKL